MAVEALGFLRRLGTSVRTRTTVAALVVVGLAIAIGALAMVSTLRTRLAEGVEASAERRADQVVASLERGRPVDLAVADEDEEFVQILAAGDVTAASENVSAERPVVDPSGADERAVDVVVDDDREAFLVVVESAEVDGQSQQVVVGHSLEEVDESVATVWSLLRVGAPALLALVGVTTWWVVGRAFRPVRRIRREVDEITATELHRRVPVPSSYDEIGQLAGTMNRMLARLEASQERQRRFVADASHELRSPVSSLRQHAEVAAAYGGPGGADGLPAVVLAESTRMGELISDLLLLARADEGTSRTRFQPVDLDDVVFEEAARLRDLTELRIDVRGVGAARIMGDAAGLRRVLRNLGDNAARHATRAIDFSLSVEDGTAELRVEDDGPGIPVADRARVLERFVRLDESRARDAGGAGLGLAIVQAVVAAHDGTIDIGDGAKGGARITIRFPEISTD